MSNSYVESSRENNEDRSINDRYQYERGGPHERTSGDRSYLERSAHGTSLRRPSISSTSSQLDSPLQPPYISKIPSSLSNWDGSPSSVSSVGTGEKPKQPFKTKSKHNLAIFGAKLSSTAASVGVHTSKYKQQRDLKEQTREPHRESVFAESPELHAFDPTNIIGSPISMKSRGLGWGSGSAENGNSNSLDLGGSVGNAGSVSGASNNGSSTGTGGSLKSKMFKQSKTDLKSLKIKTDLGIHAARSSLNERSPMARGGSNKELDRIAALGQLPNSPVHPGEFNFGHGSNSSHHHHHHPHLNFLKRDSPAAVLSSSASNSTLASEGTVYSFNQANNHAPVVSSSSHHSFKTPEEAAAFLTSSWTLLSMRIKPVFKKDEALRIPVEDVNILVFMHFTAHHEQGRSGLELLSKVDELLQKGLISSTVTPTYPTLESLSESWHYFFGKTLLSLEAIFLPLQLELDGMGQVFTNSRAASEYWLPLTGYRSSAFNKNNAIRRKSQKPNIRKRVLLAYRDNAVVPILPNIKKLLEDWAEAPAGSTEAVPSNEIVSHLLQCLTVLSNLRTHDEEAVAIDDVLKLLSKNVARQKSLDLKRRL